MPKLLIEKNNLIEENYDLSVETLQIILTYFHSHMGPKIYLASPPEVKSDIDKLVCNLLDLNLPEGFFEHRVDSAELILGNYIFEIPSEWARGEVESVMLTMVLKAHQKFSSVKEFLFKIAQKLKQTPQLYKGFYIESDKEDPEIQDKHYFLNFTISSSARFIERYLDSRQMGRILIIGNQKAGKSRLIESISKDYTKSYDEILSSNMNYPEPTTIQKLSVGRLFLEDFLEQVEIWTYDLDTLPCSLWFEVFKKPIAIIIVFDLATERRKIKTLKENIKSVFKKYCKVESNKKKLPILLLANETNHKNNYTVEEVYDIIDFNDLDLNSGVSFVSIERNFGIEESLRWLIVQLVNFKS